MLERKIFDIKDRENVYMFWDSCFNTKFCKYIWVFFHICENVLYPKVEEIVWNHTGNEKNNVCLMRKKLVENRKIFQFVYSKTYPEAYSFVEERGIDIRNEFHLKFKEWKDKSTKV